MSSKDIRIEGAFDDVKKSIKSHLDSLADTLDTLVDDDLKDNQGLLDSFSKVLVTSNLLYKELDKTLSIINGG